MLGRTLGGRYYVTKHLGSGGFGQTFLAVDQQLPGQPFCVVKQLQPQSTNTFILQTAKRLFDAEAEVLYRLGNRHEQIPQLFAHFEENQEFYLVQEFIEGNDLSKEILPGSPWSETQVIDLLKDILGVLSFVHQENVIHRDIKPENLIRHKHTRKIVLIDFGAVKETVAQTTCTQGSSSRTIVIGTPGYMPGEQAAGKPKRSSDIYAVGMIGIQALTGLAPQQLPEDPTTGETLWHNWAQASPEFTAVLDRMVRCHFKERYQSAQEALQSLENLRQSILPQTVPLSPNQLVSTVQPPSRQYPLKRSQVGWHFRFRFFIATCLGFTAGYVIVFILFIIFYSIDSRLRLGVLDTYKDENVLQIVSAFTIGTVLGFCVGVAEWLVLKKWISEIAWWIPASVFSSTLTNATVVLGANAVWHQAIFGAISGTARWSVIREKTPRAIWLIPWFAMSAAVDRLDLSPVDIETQAGTIWPVISSFTWLVVSGSMYLGIYTFIMSWILRRQ
ncbi:MAG: serine/threonine protein kinase [Cyanobacteria bacterium RU_5_0]|nr:serine/threonine protein kinase [Cyanobacteria bacterium RU_5_0]